MNRSRRILTSLGFALAIGATVPACLVTASGRMHTSGGVVITEAPPPPQEETYQPRSGYVWVRGRWDWQGRWVWQAGHWERERSGQQWADGRWEQRNNNWVWVDGSWTTYQAGNHGTITVTEHNDGGGDDRVKVRDHRGDGGGTTTVVVDDGRPHQPPPELKSENQGTRSGYVWITGRWDWQNSGWEWVPGHWERGRSKQHYRDGHWELSGDYYIWVDGDWEADAGGDVKVRDHRTH